MEEAIRGNCKPKEYCDSILKSVKMKYEGKLYHTEKKNDNT